MNSNLTSKRQRIEENNYERVNSASSECDFHFDSNSFYTTKPKTSKNEQETSASFYYNTDAVFKVEKR